LASNFVTGLTPLKEILLALEAHAGGGSDRGTERQGHHQHPEGPRKLHVSMPGISCHAEAFERRMMERV